MLHVCDFSSFFFCCNFSHEFQSIPILSIENVPILSQFIVVDAPFFQCVNGTDTKQFGMWSKCWFMRCDKARFKLIFVSYLNRCLKIVKCGCMSRWQSRKILDVKNVYLPDLNCPVSIDVLATFALEL